MFLFKRLSTLIDFEPRHCNLEKKKKEKNGINFSYAPAFQTYRTLHVLAKQSSMTEDRRSTKQGQAKDAVMSIM